MPDVRALIVAVGAAAAVAAYTILWWHWSLAIGLGVAILIGSSALVTSVSLGGDPADADAAWRRAAPDLIDDPTAALPDAGVPAPVVSDDARTDARALAERSGVDR